MVHFRRRVGMPTPTSSTSSSGWTSSNVSANASPEQSSNVSRRPSVNNPPKTECPLRYVYSLRTPMPGSSDSNGVTTSRGGSAASNSSAYCSNMTSPLPSPTLSRTSSIASFDSHERTGKGSLAMTLITHGKKLRKQASKLSLGTTTTFSEVSSPTNENGFVQSQQTAAKKSRKQQNDQDLSSPVISCPTNFQHLTHTTPQQFERLSKHKHDDLVADFFLLRASQTARKDFRGIRAKNLRHSRESSGETAPLSSVPSLTSQSSRESLRSTQFTSPTSPEKARVLRSKESFSRPFSGSRPARIRAGHATHSASSSQQSTSSAAPRQLRDSETHIGHIPEVATDSRTFGRGCALPAPDMWDVNSDASHVITDDLVSDVEHEDLARLSRDMSSYSSNYMNYDDDDTSTTSRCSSVLYNESRRSSCTITPISISPKSSRKKCPDEQRISLNRSSITEGLFSSYAATSDTSSQAYRDSTSTVTRHLQTPERPDHVMLEDDSIRSGYTLGAPKSNKSLPLKSAMARRQPEALSKSDKSKIRDSPAQLHLVRANLDQLQQTLSKLEEATSVPRTRPAKQQSQIARSAKSGLPKMTSPLNQAARSKSPTPRSVRSISPTARTQVSPAQRISRSGTPTQSTQSTPRSIPSSQRKAHKNASVSKISLPTPQRASPTTASGTASVITPSRLASSTALPKTTRTKANTEESEAKGRSFAIASTASRSIVAPCSSLPTPQLPQVTRSKLSSPHSKSLSAPASMSVPRSRLPSARKAQVY